METYEQTHPSDRQLAALALNKLEPETRRRLKRHVEQCDRCKSFLRATPRDALIKLLRRSTSSPSLADQSTPGIRDASFPTREEGVPIGADAATFQPFIQDGTSSEEIPSEMLEQSKYRIERLIGRGGMGSVYLAQHERMDRRVAIKIINAMLVDRPEALSRFDQEVKAAAKLDHPNVARAYDADEFGKLRVLVMEYVPGQSLDRLLARRGRFSVIEASRLIRQALIGLDHAHSRGMVHRDLKPQNLILTPQGKLKILDFGLAKIASERQGSRGLTRENALMGTPHYLAPEQALDAAKADIRADIYSLGCTLYYLLSGRTPFEGDTEMKVLMAHQNERPRPLSEVCADVPPALSDLVDRMLAKNPDDRPQTPKEVAEALLPFSRGQVPQAEFTADDFAFMPVSGDTVARTTTPAEPAKSPRAIRTAAIMFIGCLLLVLLVAGALTLTARSTEGTIVVENVPADVDIEVDGSTMTLSRHGEMVTISAVREGQHHLKFVRDGNEVWASDAKVVIGGQEVRVNYKGPQETVIEVQSPEKPRTVDLLQFVNLDEDIIQGEWSFSADRRVLTCQASEAILDIPYSPPAEYDMVIRFVRLKQNDPPGAMTAVGYGGNRQFHWGFDWGTDHTAGINLINYKNTNVPQLNPTGLRRPEGWIKVGTLHTMILRVRTDGIQTMWDGELVVNYRTDFHDISLWGNWKHKNTLGLVSVGPSEFRSVELIEVSGSGMPLRGNAPVGGQAPTKPSENARFTTAEVREGEWRIEGDELVGTNGQDGWAAILLGDPNRPNFNFNLQAKADQGPDGIEVYFNWLDRGRFRHLVLGGWKNTKYGLSAVVDGRTDNARQVTAEARIEYGRWYDIRVEVRGARCRCSYDDGNTWYEQTDDRFLTGRIGLGTCGAAVVRYRNLVVTADDGRTILFQGLPSLPASQASASPVKAETADTGQQPQTVSLPAESKPAATPPAKSSDGQTTPAVIRPRMPAPARKPEMAIDLLKLVSLPRDQIAGHWKLEREGLHGLSSDWAAGKHSYATEEETRKAEDSGTRRARLHIPYRPRGEYEVRAVLSTDADEGSYGFVLAHEDRRFQCHVNQAGNDLAAGIGLVGPVGKRGAYTHAPLVNAALGRRSHEIVIRVEEDSVTTTIDGKTAMVHRTDYSDLTLFPENHWRDEPGSLGITSAVPITLHTLTLRPLVAEIADLPRPDGKAWLELVDGVETNTLGMDFTYIPAGGFIMGSPPDEPGRDADEGPMHFVKITHPFYLGSTEVTRRQWTALSGTTPWRNAGAADDRAAGNITQVEAVQFCKKLTDGEHAAGKLPRGAEYRLPTEAEWEYACRAGYSGAHGIPPGEELGTYAWYSENNAAGRIESPYQVAQKKPNAWGLYDMLGNVWEWCSDKHAFDYYQSGPAVDPQGPQTGDTVVRRGGSYHDRNFVRAANRHSDDPKSSFETSGFRVVRTISETELERESKFEAIARELREARQSYSRDVATRQAELLALLEDRVKKAKGNTKKRTADELADFKATKTLPNAVPQKFTLAANGARNQLSKAYQRLTNQLRQIDRESLADSLARELEELPTEFKERVKTGDKFQSLFNGRDLTGWKLHPSQNYSWRVENGILIGQGPRSYLYSEQDDFTDVHVRAEVRCNAQGNGGVHVRTPFGPHVRNSWVSAYEAQICPMPRNAKEIATGGIYIDSKTTAPSSVPTSPEAWFTLEMIVRGNEVMVLVNGKQTAQAVDGAQKYRRGHITLELHDDRTRIEFRKIEVQRL